MLQKVSVVKMNCTSSKLNLTVSLPTAGSGRPSCNTTLKRLYTSSKVPILRFFCRDIESTFGLSLETRKMRYLLIETTLVTIATILAIKVLATSSVTRPAWFMAPGILVAAAVIPTAIKAGEFAKLGFNFKQISHSFVLLVRTCCVIFPAMFCGLWLLKTCGLELPLWSGPPQGQGWFRWLCFQFMYVAVAEEVFFRGYVQSNILSLISTVKPDQHRLQEWISISISAAVFAAAHIIVRGQITTVLTFLPGLVLGWLFIRTRSLLAPILFHGLANVCYSMAAFA